MRHPAAGPDEPAMTTMTTPPDMPPDLPPDLPPSADPSGPGVPGVLDEPAPGARSVLGAGRALKVVAAFLGTQMVVAVVVGVWVGLRHARGRAPTGGGFQLDARAAIGAAVVGTLLGGLAAVGLIARTAHGWADVGWRRATARACVGAAAQGLGLVVVFVSLARLLPTPRALGPLASLAQSGGWARAAWALLAFAVAPPVEELVFRGALYAGLARAGRPLVAAVVTTVVFVGLHAAEIGRYWPAWVAIGLLGALALRVRVRTGSLLPAIILHASYNLGLVLAVYAQR